MKRPDRTITTSKNESHHQTAIAAVPWDLAVCLCLQDGLILLPQVGRRHTESWMPLQEAWCNLAASLCQVSVKSVLVDYAGLINAIPFPSAPRLQPSY